MFPQGRPDQARQPDDCPPLPLYPPPPLNTVNDREQVQLHAVVMGDMSSVPSAPTRKPVLGCPAILVSGGDRRIAEGGKHPYLPVFTYLSPVLRKWRPSDTSAQGIALLVADGCVNTAAPGSGPGPCDVSRKARAIVSWDKCPTLLFPAPTEVQSPWPSGSPLPPPFKMASAFTFILL